jgi:hypothetical protein
MDCSHDLLHYKSYLWIFPLRKIEIISHKEVIEFITEHIIHRFGIPQTLATDQGTTFVSTEVREFPELYKIKLLNSSPYYAQANGQAKSSNKTLIKLIKKKIEENPRRWHEVLSKALWAHRTSRHSGTKVTPLSWYMVKRSCCPLKIWMRTGLLNKMIYLLLCIMI